MAEELGLRPRWVIPVPLLTPRLSSCWIHLVTPLSHSIAKPLAEGLRNPVVCREDRITKRIPQELLSVRASIHAAISEITAHLVETSWSMASPKQVEIENVSGREKSGYFIGFDEAGYHASADCLVDVIGDRSCAAEKCSAKNERQEMGSSCFEYESCSRNVH
jgi:hypothetical protein